MALSRAILRDKRRAPPDVGRPPCPLSADFLRRVAEVFEVVIFTASQKLYAEKLLNILDPHRTLIR